MRLGGKWLILLPVLVSIGLAYSSLPFREMVGGAVAGLAAANPASSPVETGEQPVPTAVAAGTPTPASAPTPAIEASEALSRLSASRETTSLAVRDAAVELPRRLKIPTIGVDAAFEFVGLAADGAMDVPKDPHKVAWYRLGPRPGERGNAVIAGHVDWGDEVMVFWRLKELKAGDTVEVEAADGRKLDFAVQWSRWYEADRAPVAEVFGQSGAVEVTLITCGGAFDPRTRQYPSRLVVRAALR